MKYYIFLFLAVCLLFGCNFKKTSKFDNTAILLKNYENKIVASIFKIVQIDENDKKSLQKICSEIQSDLISYIKVNDKSPRLEDIKASYQNLYQHRTKAYLNDFLNKLQQLKPVLYTLQTNILFESKDALSILPSNTYYRPGKLAEICPLIDSFLRLSFDESTNYALFIIKLFNFKYTSSLFKI